MKRYIPILLWLGALLLIAFALLRYESDLLWKVQQYNLFLDTPFFFRERMLESGGFLSYVSCYFTQYFYHPWLGVLILCGWWMLLMWLIKRTFCISSQWAIVALIPVAILLVADMCLGYWHYFMRLRGYFFVPTIGTTVAVAMLWVFRALPQRLWLRIVWLFVVIALGYPLFGIYALVAALLMVIWVWRLSNNRKQNAVLTIVALLLIIAIPLLCYRYVYYQTHSADIWTTALPAFIIQESYPHYYIPYYLLGGFFLLMVIITNGASSKPSIGKGELLQKPIYRWGMQGLIVVALIAGVWYFWYKDDNFHHELAMHHCLEQSDWEGILREGQKQNGEPTRSIVVMHNLALSRLGRQLDEMYTFPEGSKRCNTPIPFNMFYHIFGRTIYYQYGMLNDSHRRCLEDGVEYGWHVEILQYMARCSMLSGEKMAARKVLNLLRHTKYYDKWADDMQQLLEQPKLIAENREMGPITHLLHYKNALGFDSGDVERYVMNSLSRQDSFDPYFQEQAVLATLWLKNPQKFWNRFRRYATLHPRQQMPVIFQQAAYLFIKQGARPDLDNFPFDKNVKTTYEAFMKDAAKYNGQSPQVGRAFLRPFYGNTYYYDYYFGTRK